MDMTQGSPCAGENVRMAGEDDLEILAHLVSESNKDVALLFGLNVENCPKHPSFCSADWIKADMARGECYFLLERDGRPIGCVACENAGEGVMYLNRLSVLPSWRNRGFGQLLVSHVIEMAQFRDMHTLSIGVIGEHAVLQCWYEKLGFIGGEIRHFAHLPFSVKYMTYSLPVK